jgi:secreted PhoX family phosphatase
MACCLALPACAAEDGATGADGVDGRNGADGTDGRDGTDGADGTDGRDGTDGTDGTDGRDGVVRSLRFEAAQLPTTDADKRVVGASTTAFVDGEAHAIGYHAMLRSGDEPGGAGAGQFGLIVDEDGAPVTVAGEPYVSDSTDFSSLLPVGDRLFEVTHFESRPGAMYLTELSQDAATGELTAMSTAPIDFASWGGLWVPCAGSVTPWKTHLGGEEYPPDARIYDEATTLADVDPYDWGMYRYFGLDMDTDVAPVDGLPDVELEDVKAVFNPYAYGYPVEVVVSEDGDASVTKHYAMGRLALELAKVMPDQRTVYLSDDGTNVGFYMFVADAPGDLSAGALYAMRFIQTSAEGAGHGDLLWIPLGHATQAEIAPMITGPSPLTFGELFEAEAPVDDACPSAASGFVLTIANGRQECLRVIPGMEQAASRLETRRYADYLGATMELRKEEGIAYDPHTNRIFVAMSEVAKGMEDGSSAEAGGRNDVRVEGNPCGAVYALDLAPSSALGSEYVATHMYPLVEGRPTSYAAGTPFEHNTCSVNGIASPDNLTFVDGYRTLIIGEDTGDGHQNDAVWSYDMVERTLTRIFTTPYGSETTSPYWYPNINGFAYLKVVVQHPFGEADAETSEAEMPGRADDPSDLRAYDGYLGPFPAMD